MYEFANCASLLLGKTSKDIGVRGYSAERAKDGGGKDAILVRENFIKKRMEGKKINGIFQK